MTFPDLLIIWPPTIPTATPFGGGGGGFIDFLDSSWNLPDFWNFYPQPPPRNPRGGMGKKTNFIDFLDSSWNLPDFWIFYPQPPGTPRVVRAL